MLTFAQVPVFFLLDFFQNSLGLEKFGDKDAKKRNFNNQMGFRKKSTPLLNRLKNIETLGNVYHKLTRQIMQNMQQ